MTHAYVMRELSLKQYQQLWNGMTFCRGVQNYQCSDRYWEMVWYLLLKWFKGFLELQQILSLPFWKEKKLNFS